MTVIVTNPGGRELLAAARTYYVRTDGSDSNTGLVDSAGGAFLTVQKAYNTITANLDLAGQTVTVQIKDGTYTGGVNLAQSWTGGGAVTFQGNNGTPANVLISTTSSDCYGITSPLPGILTIKDQKMTCATSGTCINISSPCVVNYTNVDFGAVVDFHVQCNGTGSFAKGTGNYTISGGATSHWAAVSCGVIIDQSKTITLTGTPAFSFATAYGSRCGEMTINANTFSGSATGTRWSADFNGVIFTNTPPNAYIPGNANGSATTGGQCA